MARVLAASLSFCKYSVHQAAGNLLREAGIQVDVNEKGKAMTEAELLSVIEDYDAVVVGTDPMTAAVIQKGKNLKVIAKNGVGYDNIDVTAATQQRVFVTITPGTVEKTVADSTFALMLALARNVTLGDTAIRKGEWPRLVGEQEAGPDRAGAHRPKRGPARPGLPDGRVRLRPLPGS
jgi:D-3-phosphoglycerate dehydrogenase